MFSHSILALPLPFTVLGWGFPVVTRSLLLFSLGVPPSSVVQKLLAVDVDRQTFTVSTPKGRSGFSYFRIQIKWVKATPTTGNNSVYKENAFSKRKA